MSRFTEFIKNNKSTINKEVLDVNTPQPVPEESNQEIVKQETSSAEVHIEKEPEESYNTINFDF